MEFYLLKSSITLFVFLGYYWFFLRKDTIFSTNRIYLLATLILGISAPLFNFSWEMKNEAIQTINAAFTPTYIIAQTYPTPAANQLEWWTLKNILFLIYGIGTLTILIRYFIQIFPWIKLISKYKGIPEDISIIKTDKQIPPFSFINTIFIGKQEFSPEELNNIISHEKQHILQYHWIDLLIVDILSIVFWFNPLIWIYDLLIKQNHEYLADNGVIAQGFNKSSYQALLLQQVVGVKIPGLSNSFSHSLIKNRFIMMTKNHSRKIAGAKALFAIPLLALLTILFSSNTSNSLTSDFGVIPKEGKITGYVYDQSTGKPLEKASVVFKENIAIGCSTNAKGYFELDNTNAYKTIIVTYVGYKTEVIKIDEPLVKILMERVNYPVSLTKNENGNLAFNIPAPPPPPPPQNGSKEESAPPPPPPASSNKEEFWTVVEDMPTPKGGFDGLSDYINKQLLINKKDEFKGLVAEVLFSVNEKGKVMNVRLKESSGNKTADNIAQKIIKEMPDWKPGSQQGKTVPVDYVTNIVF